MPYAAKATIEHEFVTNHVNIYTTFRHSMNVNLKPTNSIWIIDFDGSAKTANSSAWLDEFTLTLSILSIASAPVRVTVQYDGPSPLLTTTWDKQWYPFGPIVSTDLTSVLWISGMIIAWKGSIATIPSGWVLCNGSNGTPDLRNRFIVCANADSSGVAKTTITGSPSQTGGIISHYHDINIQANSTLDAGIDLTMNPPFGDTGLTATVNVMGATSAKDVLPPYFALAYIMKV